MANGNKMNVSKVADIPAIQENSKEVVDVVRQMVADINKQWQGVKITLPALKESGDLQSLVQNSKAAGEAVVSFQKELEKAAKENTRRLLAFEKQRQDAIKESQRVDADFQKELEKNGKENIKNLLTYERQKQKEAAATRKEIEEYVKSVKDGQKEMAKLFAEREKMAQNEIKAANKQADKEAAAIAKDNLRIAKEYSAALRQVKKDTDELAKANLKEAKELERCRSAYTLLSDAHIKLKQVAKDLGAELGVESAEFKKASAEANRLGDRLKAIDGNLGVHGRNVGNYATQWNGLSYSMTNIISELPNAAQSPEIFLRSISNNIAPVFENIRQINRENRILIAQGKPVASAWKQIQSAIFSTNTALMIGVALLVRYGADVWNALVKTGDGAVKASDGTKVYTKELKVMSEVYKEAATTYAKTAAELDILKTRFFDSAATAKTKQEVIKTLNENYEDSIGKIKGINDAEDFFINRSQAFIEALRLRAEMEAAYNVLAENRKILLKQEATAVEDNVSGWQKFSAFNKTLFSSDGAKAITKSFGVIALGAKGTKDNFEQLYKSRLDWQSVINTSEVSNAVQKSNSIVEKFILKQSKELEAFNAKYGFGDGKKEPKEKKAKAPTDLTNAEISAAERINKAKAEMKKVELEDEKNTAQAIFQNEQSTLNERLRAHSDYLNATLALSKIERDTELKDIQVNLDKIAAIEGGKGKRTPQETKLLAQKEAFEEEKTAITYKYAIKTNDIIAKSQSEALTMIKQGADEELKYRVSSLENISNQVDQRLNGELTTLSQQLLSKEITIEEFDKRRKNIEGRYAQERLSMMAEYLQEEIDTLRLQGADVTELQDRLDKINIERIKAQVDAVKSGEELKREEIAKTLSLIEDASGVLDGVNNLSKAFAQQKLEDLEMLKDAEQTRSEEEIEQIRNSQLTTEQKEEAIQKAQAKTREQQAQFEQQERDAKIKQAIQDKALAIFKATIDIASAIIKSLGNPVQVAIAAATGAAQLANIIATPVPAYAMGTDDHPGGPAIVGDGGRKEAIITKEGQVMITPAVPTMINLPAHAQVLPSISSLMAYHMLNSPVMYSNLNNQQAMKDITPVIESQTRALQHEQQETRRLMRMQMAQASKKNSENRGFYLSQNVYK